MLTSFLKLLEKKRYTASDIDKIKGAFDFAESAHRGQKRISGEPFIAHPLAVAFYLAEMGMDRTILVSSILHDVLDDTSVAKNLLQKEFGRDVAQLVEEVTKISKIKFQGAQRYLENLRHFFQTVAADLRAPIIKFADRIHNLKSLNTFPVQKQQRIAAESLEIYAPIATRLGMGQMRDHLEDLSFCFCYFKEYQRLTNAVKKRFSGKEAFLKSKIQPIISRALAEQQIRILSIHTRRKHFYSLWKRLKQYKGDFSKVFDLVVIRIIVPTINDCYTTLGIIHHLWPPMRDRIKDYIAQPKPNGYRSLHTTVLCENNEVVEFQIRTMTMHQLAEHGIATRWYHRPTEATAMARKQMPHWLEELVIAQKELSSLETEESVLHSLKIDTFSDRIFVFASTGKRIDLPAGATVLDLAYAVDTAVGNNATGFFVDGVKADYKKKLEYGDIVEVSTKGKKLGPQLEWLKAVKTRKAHRAIEEYLKASAIQKFKDFFKRWRKKGKLSTEST